MWKTVQVLFLLFMARSKTRKITPVNLYSLSQSYYFGNRENSASRAFQIRCMSDAWVLCTTNLVKLVYISFSDDMESDRGKTQLRRTEHSRTNESFGVKRDKVKHFPDALKTYIISTISNRGHQKIIPKKLIAIIFWKQISLNSMVRHADNSYETPPTVW